mgnify:CR=1 FL=1
MSNVNKEYSDTTLGTQEPQVTVVGSEFVPGNEGNAMISQARGYHVMRFPNGEAYHTRGGYLMELVPDYCGDSAMTCELLEILGVALMVLPAEKPKGVRKFEPGFSAFYEVDNKLYATVPMPTEDDACACALWSVLGVSHD